MKFKRHRLCQSSPTATDKSGEWEGFRSNKFRLATAAILPQIAIVGHSVVVFPLSRSRPRGMLAREQQWLPL
jgi:hypothetical protein